MITKGAIKFDVESHWSLPNREIEDFFRYVKLNLENYLLTDAIGLKKRNKLIESTTEEILEWIDDLANFLNEKKSNNNLERLLRTLQNDFRSNSY